MASEHEFRTVVVMDTGSERHCYETAISVWRDPTNKKSHTINVVYEDPKTGEIEQDEIYGARILYDAPTYGCTFIPSIDEIIEETTVYDESYWGST